MCPNVPLPSSFPFSQRDPELIGLSVLAGLLDIDGDVASELEAISFHINYKLFS